MTTRHRSTHAFGVLRRAFLTRAATFAGGAALSLGLLPACAPQARAPASKEAARPPTAAPAEKSADMPPEKPAASALREAFPDG
jgi:hypothetical protein